MTRTFGTDGVRGEANVVLTPELGLALGRALGKVLHGRGGRPEVVVGRDPRWSGDMLDAALVAGLASAGVDAIDVGVVPTAAVAYLTRRIGASAGAMISASHNPVGDNGIKFFGADGFKLTDAEEDRIDALLTGDGASRPTGTAIGRRRHDARAVDAYVDHLVGLAEVDLAGLKVVVDGANGAAAEVAPDVYRRLGAEVVAIHCAPDGRNINDQAGSTYPATIARAVVEHGADVGISHDGDADRLIACAHDGTIVDGDVILAILARHLHARGDLAGGTVVTTVMTNLGFKRAMAGLGIEVVETKVGDRYVLEALRERDLNLGGEPSGHLIALDHTTTGDGILSAVQLLSVVRASGVGLAELATVMTRLPQVLVNVRGVDRDRLATAEAVWQVVHEEEDRLGGGGRVLVRGSGTEPLVRVMAEADTEQEAQRTVERIADAVRDHLAL